MWAGIIVLKCNLEGQELIDDIATFSTDVPDIHSYENNTAEDL
jgi:hypothetical protein